MLSRLKTYKISLFLFLVLFISGCATIYNPATGKNEGIFIDTKQEVYLGTNMHKELKRQVELENDLQMNGRLNRIGERVAKVSDRQDLEYHFFVIKDDQLNAMTSAGGFIYVNTGLMKIANDDELACVLAHEIGHVAARHTVKKLQTVLGYQILLGIVAGATSSGVTVQAIDVVFSLSSLGYGRKDELSADKLSVKYAKKAGYSPYGAITFFAKLREEAKKKGAANLPIFLSSHPLIDERIKQIEKEINSST